MTVAKMRIVKSYMWMFECAKGLVTRIPALFKGHLYLELPEIILHNIHWFYCPSLSSQSGDFVCIIHSALPTTTLAI